MPTKLSKTQKEVLDYLKGLPKSNNCVITGKVIDGNISSGTMKALKRKNFIDFDVRYNSITQTDNIFLNIVIKD